ncbi:MAG TPA: FG-GAP-like repeat-containing protein [Pyrinomonadaceae bacterium]|nr:FG-GAP-like repeat-containing protein [Pyrinomonadaceae bacterium]
MKTIIFNTLLLFAFFLVSSNEAKAQYCTYTVTPASANFSAAGGQGNFSVTDYDFCAWQAVSNVNWITINSGSGSGTGQITFTVEANASQAARTGTISVGSNTFVVNQVVYFGLNRKTPFDFNGDKKTDFAIFAPERKEWHMIDPKLGYYVRFFPFPTERAVPADYDGDGITDFAIISTDGTWYYQSTLLKPIRSLPAFGLPGDYLVPGDWDGDGKADQAVYRMGAKESEQSYFYFRGSLNNPDGNITFIPFGKYGDLPIMGDYDGDGRLDPTIFRPSVGEWWILRSSDKTSRVFQFGRNGDKPVSGDFTGDGRTDIAIFRPSTGEWFILRSEDNSYYSAPFGRNGDIPVVGDYDGDGRDDIGVWRPSNGFWYIAKSSGGFLVVEFGGGSNIPIPAIYLP